VPAPDPELLAAALHRGGLGAYDIDGLHRVSGGASRETWLFDATGADGHVEHLVLRRDPGKATLATERSTEYALLAAAHEAGVAAPRVRMLLDDGDDLGSGFVMDRVDGETIPRKILRDDAFADARGHLAFDCGTIAARVHAVPTATLPELPLLDAPGHMAQWRGLLDALDEPHSAFELGMRWMEDHLPAATEPRLVHGDLRNGNLMVGPEGIRALLDWELAHLGDPIEDLGWLCVRAWRFNERGKVAAGFGSVDELLDGYEAGGGMRPTLDTLRFWVVLGTLRWGGIAMMQAFTHLQGRVRSVELAAIGRRVAETEWDLLRLLDGGW
jgi:aminoglycoside phosphotransferase (APT) family kinase protein